MKLLTRV